MRPLPGVHLQPVHLARSVKVRLRLQPKLVHLQPVHLANPNPNPNPNPNQDAGHLWLQPLARTARATRSIGRGAPMVTA